MTVLSPDGLGTLPAGLLADAFEHSPVGKAVAVLHPDRAGRLVALNHAAAGLLGHRPADLLGRPVTDLLARGGRDALAGLTAMGRGELDRCEAGCALRHADGSVVPVRVVGNVVRDGERTFVVVETCEAPGDAVLDAIFASSPDLLLLRTASGQVLRANDAWATALDRPRAVVLSRGIEDLVHPGDAALAETEVRRYRGAGGHRRLQAHRTPLPGRLELLTFRDLTEEAALADALHRTEQQAWAAFEHSPLGMGIAAEDGTFLRVNPAFAALLGREPADLLGHNWRGFTHPDDRVEGERQHRLLAADPSMVAVFDKRFVRPDGGDTWTRLRLTTIDGPGGERHRLVQAEDVTDARQAGDLAARETQRLRTTIAVQRGVTAAATDRDAVIRVLTERTPEAIPGADACVVALIDGDLLRIVAATGTMAGAEGVTVPLAGSIAAPVLSGQTVRIDETADDPRVDPRTGPRFGIRSAIITSLFADGSPFGTLTVSSVRPHAFDDADARQLALLAETLTGALRRADDTTRKAELLRRTSEALAALQDSERRFRLSFDNSVLGMLLTDLTPGNEGTCLQANEAMAQITGYPIEQLVGMRTQELRHRDGSGENELLPAQLVSGELDSVTVDRRLRHADGHLVWARLQGALVRDDAGRPAYLVTQVQDVTELRRAEAHLAERAQLLDLTQDAVIVRGLDGRIRYWNPAAERIYGWPADIAVGRELDRLLATGWPSERLRLEALQTLLREGSWEGELSHRGADGRRLTVLSRKALQRDADGLPIAILSINTDVTDRRAAEAALAHSEQRFRTQFAHAPIGQLIRGVDDLVQEVNPAFAEMIGCRPEELVGVPATTLIWDEALDARRAQLAGIWSGDRDSFSMEAKLVRRDGSLLDVHASLSVIRDADGHPDRFVGIFQDVSEQRAAEAARDAAMDDLADRNDQLEAANHLKLDLIGMLGHEIGNPLAVILGSAELAADPDEPPDADELKALLAAISRNAHRLQGIVGEVLALVTLDAGRLVAAPEAVRVGDHLDATVATAGLPPTPLECPVGLTAQVQPGHLDQILTNLVSNAGKYGGGVTRIVAARDGDVVRIRVEDSGPGVPEQFREHLFERFSRDGSTAGRVQGTGLGLYIVRELAHANGGDVHYEPGEPGGSAFVITLPA